MGTSKLIYIHITKMHIMMIHHEGYRRMITKIDRINQVSGTLMELTTMRSTGEIRNLQQWRLRFLQFFKKW